MPGVNDDLMTVYDREEDLPEGVSQPVKFPPKAPQPVPEIPTPGPTVAELEQQLAAAKASEGNTGPAGVPLA